MPTENYYTRLLELLRNNIYTDKIQEIFTFLGKNSLFWLYGGKLESMPFPPDYNLEPFSEEPDSRKEEIEIPLPPDIRVKELPKNPYEEDTTPSLDPQIEFPEYPEKPYADPPINPDNYVDQEFTVTLKQPLYLREFGCLLPQPFVKQDITWCIYEDENMTTFWDNLFLDMQLKIEELVNSTDEIGRADLALGTLFLPFLSLPLLLFGTEHYQRIARYYKNRARIIDNFPSSGLINVGAIEYQQCTPPESNLEYEDFNFNAINHYALATDKFEELVGDIKTDQLIIFWRHYEYDPYDKVRMQTTFPNPIDLEQLTGDLFRNTLPQRFSRGTAIVHTDLVIDNLEENRKYKQNGRVFIQGTCQEDIDNFIHEFYEPWLQAFTQDVSLNNYRGIFKYQFEIKEVDFFPYKAVVYGWDLENNLWRQKYQEYIYVEAPTV